MSDPELLARYNYDSFVPPKFEPWMRFEESPSLGKVAPDFPLWPLEGGGTSLSAVWSSHTYTIVSLAASPDRTAGWRRHP